MGLELLIVSAKRLDVIKTTLELKPDPAPEIVKTADDFASVAAPVLHQFYSQRPCLIFDKIFELIVKEYFTMVPSGKNFASVYAATER